MPNKRKVLIIDDDARNTFALEAVLKAKGYHCIARHGAMEGIEILSKQDDIGIVLLDMMMPEMDGHEALGLIRSGLKRDIPVIAVTAQAMLGDREKSIEAGADDYVSKPVDIDVLLPLLEKYLK